MVIREFVPPELSAYELLTSGGASAARACCGAQSAGTGTGARLAFPGERQIRRLVPAATRRAGVAAATEPARAMRMAS